MSLEPVLRRYRKSRARFWRAEGDRARDAREWSVAVEAYRRHLERFDDDAAIWVQYGHALKEAGRLADALDAYQKSALLDPDDEDRDLHLSVLRQRISELGLAEDSEGLQRKLPQPPRSERVTAAAEVSDRGLLAERLRS